MPISFIIRALFALLFVGAAILPGWVRYVVAKSLRKDLFLAGSSYFTAAMAGPQDLFVFVALVAFTGVAIAVMTSMFRRYREPWANVSVLAACLTWVFSFMEALLAAYMTAEAMLGTGPFWRRVLVTWGEMDRFSFIGDLAYAVTVAAFSWSIYQLQRLLLRDSSARTTAAARHA